MGWFFKVGGGRDQEGEVRCWRACLGLIIAVHPDFGAEGIVCAVASLPTFQTLSHFIILPLKDQSETKQENKIKIKKDTENE